VRSVVVAGLLALGIGIAPAAAHADATVVVPGTAFPSSSTYLTYFGCADLYHADARGPEVRVSLDDGAPMGERATALALPGTGTASGPVSLVGSVATATSRLSVNSAGGASGVAYVWYVSSELDAGQVWAGRADLATGAGWQQVDAAAASYRWTKYDTGTGRALKSLGAATIKAFSAAHGDGPGYLLSGFGCDGQAFEVDALQVGTPGSVVTYDLEGWAVSTSISASRRAITAGQQLQLTGTSVDPSGRTMGAELRLEARAKGAAEFAPVGGAVAAGSAGNVVTTVSPDVTTDYRWVFPETGYADSHVSPAVRVVVKKPEPSPSASPSAPAPPTASPSGPAQPTESPKQD
jgi:hypothetical protein